MLESAVLSRVKSRARYLGLSVIRMHMGPGVEAGWPDTMVLGKDGRTMFVETKRPGLPLEPAQKVKKADIVSRGIRYEKPDTPDEVDVLMEDFARECGITSAWLTIHETRRNEALRVAEPDIGIDPESFADVDDGGWPGDA